MLVAAGMDAERYVEKLEMYVKEAKEAWLAEKDDPDKASLLKSIYREEREKLDRFQQQQVAGGEDLSEAARIDLHGGVRQKVVRLAGETVQGHATRPSSLGMQGILHLCVHPTRAAQLSCTARN